MHLIYLSVHLRHGRVAAASANPIVGFQARLRPALGDTACGQRQRWSRGGASSSSSISGSGALVRFYREKSKILRQRVVTLSGVKAKGRRICPGDPEEQQIQRPPWRGLHLAWPRHRHVCVYLVYACVCERASACLCMCVEVESKKKKNQRAPSTGRDDPAAAFADHGNVGKGNTSYAAQRHGQDVGMITEEETEIRQRSTL